MLITFSTAFVFGLITGVLVWTKRVGVGTALAVWLSGFTLASTGLAGPVNTALASVITALTQLH
ncbi:hypothetical protein LO771_13805 [Streptacidiphilus sp. ASG 303]|uniref:hypothetical protein n=1 Tax=Streptacidiphilus sp. ASG 303 TaxID=2896847 RepID=UPI001E342D7D|nr:hypothetical protein [Streptacidiphilus sp. ASG 303]MCD0483447.1 hypothetical protein [Streptacidiphilus sp. ASG 303]